MANPEAAVELFREGYSCSQAILASHAESLGLERDTALRIASSFGGGMAAMGLTCGAVTGAFMVLGMTRGSIDPQDRPAKERAYRLARRFAAEFQRRNGSLQCRELLGCEIDTPEKLAQAREKGLFTTVCPQLVRDAAVILEDLLANTRETACG